MSDLLVTCLIVFCTVLPEGRQGQCDRSQPFNVVETRELATNGRLPWKSPAFQACEARFMALREMAPASTEWPIWFEPARERRSHSLAEGQ
jgi:hypothetical protein